MRSGRGLLAGLAVVMATTLLAVFLTVVVGGPSNPFSDRDLYVWPDASAANAARTASDPAVAAELESLAAVPTAIWLTPEALPTAQVGRTVSTILDDADGDLVVFVVYGITDRDCLGAESAGGLGPVDYVAWVDAIAEALRDDAVVILEPDALATAGDCGPAAERLELLRLAGTLLSREATVYLDAGHSAWVKAEEMASRLRDAGVDRLRGFSLNVANYQPDAHELRYAEQIRTTLPQAHYVVDSGRNGVATAGDEWCNPSGQHVGVRPTAVDDDSALDARLWIKPPGESDGQCGGGPPAGRFWVERALDLAAVS